MKDDQKQYEDLMQTEDSTLSLKKIEFLVHHKGLLEYFEKEYGEKLYSEILLVLTHERYETNEAKSLWDKINLHLDSLRKKLERDPGITVATLDYLTNFHHSLSYPVIIQEDKSDFISETTTRDELTQLYLKSVFNYALEKELEKSFRSEHNLSLLMIDIDDFKEVNDTYGHVEGDVTLKTIGELINENVRKMDTAARYGGEEFAIIVPESVPDEAVSLAQRIRKEIAKLRFSAYSVTVSIGVCHLTSDIKSMKDIINRADKALYKAKQSGKNQVVVFKEE